MLDYESSDNEIVSANTSENNDSTSMTLVYTFGAASLIIISGFVIYLATKKKKVVKVIELYDSDEQDYTFRSIENNTYLTPSQTYSEVEEQPSYDLGNVEEIYDDNFYDLATLN